MTSIRLRLIDGLRRVCDHVSERCVQALCSDNIQPQPSANFDNRTVAELCNEGAKRQVYDAVRMANLSQDINKIDPSGLVNDLEVLTSQRQLLTAADNYVVHQNPQSKNHPDLARLNARSAGVES